jgi:hypothetical protein
MSRKSKSVLPKVRKVCVVCNGSGRSGENYHVASCELSTPGVMVFDSCRCSCVPKKCPGCGGTGKRERTAHRIAREVMES